MQTDRNERNSNKNRVRGCLDILPVQGPFSNLQCPSLLLRICEPGLQYVLIVFATLQLLQRESGSGLTMFSTALPVPHRLGSTESPALFPYGPSPAPTAIPEHSSFKWPANGTQLLTMPLCPSQTMARSLSLAHRCSSLLTLQLQRWGGGRVGVGH